MSNMTEWKILVVEDEPDGQTVVSGILGYFGVTVYSVGTAEEALEAIASQPFTGAVIDLMLPGMDGIALIGQIRHRSTNVSLPCLAITAYHTSTVRDSALDAGFNAYFPKPLDDTSFIRELMYVIDGQ